MEAHNTPDTIARDLQEWERFFLTEHAPQAAGPDLLDSLDGADLLDSLDATIAAALGTPDAYLRALADRCDTLAARWVARTLHEERSARGAGAVTRGELEAVLARSGAPAQGGGGNVYDLWTGRRVQ